MNRLKIFIDNFLDDTVESFQRIKIYIADFPSVLGMVFLSRVYAVCKVSIKLINRLFFKTQIYAVSKIISRKLLRLVINAKAYPVSKIIMHIRMKIGLNHMVYSFSNMKMRIKSRLTNMITTAYSVSKMVIRGAYFYPIDERRDLLIKDCVDMDITDFIRREV